jgi:hypothetical protein
MLWVGDKSPSWRNINPGQLLRGRAHALTVRLMRTTNYHGDNVKENIQGSIVWDKEILFHKHVSLKGMPNCWVLLGAVFAQR